jgi:uroporphyrinogen decarboxylase
MAEMTKTERVRAALQGAPVDRIPFCFWHHFQPHGSPQRLADATVDFFTRFDLDIYKIMPDIPYPFPRGGIKTADDWLLLEPLDPLQGNTGRLVKTVELVKRAVGEDAPVVLTVFSPLTRAMQFAGGGDALRTHLTEHPVALHGGLGVLSRNLAYLCEAAIDAGADGIFFAIQGIGDGLLSPEEYAEFGRPYDLHCLRACAAGWLNILHAHASRDLMVEKFVDYPVPVLNYSDRLTGFSLKQMRERASQFTLMGGVSEQGPITKGSREAIAAEMQDALAQVGGHRFILANGCSVPNDNPEDLLAMAREEARRLKVS